MILFARSMPPPTPSTRMAATATMATVCHSQLFSETLPNCAANCSTLPGTAPCPVTASTVYANIQPTTTE
jgi:hypothetical protein